MNIGLECDEFWMPGALGEPSMQSTSYVVDLVAEADSTDREPPALLGFLFGAGLGVLLWGLIGSLAWRLLS